MHAELTANWPVRRSGLRGVTNQHCALNELCMPPGNHLEALSGDRKGQHSIRVNEQYRICFVWTDLGPDEVEIVDYH
jgi:plasmid maintenance system killer protein